MDECIVGTCVPFLVISFFSAFGHIPKSAKDFVPSRDPSYWLQNHKEATTVVVGICLDIFVPCHNKTLNVLPKYLLIYLCLK